MYRHTILLTMLLSLFSVTVIAEEASIQDQIIEIKNRIEKLEKSNEQLRMEITSKDEEVMRMKQQLQELEEKIRNN